MKIQKRIFRQEEHTLIRNYRKWKQKFKNNILTTPYSPNELLQTGDILITTSFVPLIRHYAIYYHDTSGKPLVADNVFWSHKLEVSPIDEYKKARNIIGIIRNENTTSLTDEYIQSKVEQAKQMNYQFFGFNCEDFVRSVCGCYIGIDQRIKYMVLIIFILTAIILFYKCKS